MNQCQIYNSRSLNFFRATCGFLALLAFLIQNSWLVLVTGLLFMLGVFSMRFNFLYQFHSLISKNILKQKLIPVQKDVGEIKFVYGFTGICFLISFLMIFFNKFADLGWVLDITVSFLTLLASFTNICAAALMYAIYKKVFRKR
jgi:hypothetical protein